ncbi:hypothetical protein ACFV80_37955 [Streptomyces sp. NPDC059862]|uniref:hypothetical protein n=1 Tax=Streptomyces sp. NPDC059862 TaxID=3346975 RepID=UPI00365659FD
MLAHKRKVFIHHPSQQATGVLVTGVEVIVAALAAGATAGFTDTVSDAVRQSYASLRELVRRRLEVHGDAAVQVLDAEEVEPDVWQAQLGEHLIAAGAGRDEQILRAAQTLLAQVESHSGPASKYTVDAREAKGVQTGDHNTQTNNFN